MRKLYLLFIPLSFILPIFLFSCKKLNDDRSELIVGKWRYSRAVFANSSLYPTAIEFDEENFTVEFQKSGKMIIEDNGVVKKYNIRKFNDEISGHQVANDLWRARISLYANDDDLEYFAFYYYGPDSIAIQRFPRDFVETPFISGNILLNMFHRVE